MISYFRVLFIVFLISPLLAESTHTFLARGVIAPAIVKPADTQEDYHAQPLIALMTAPGTLVMPAGDDKYKCPKSFKPKVSFGPKKEDSSSENSSKPGCGSVPLGVEAEYRFKDALRLSYSRFNLPSSNYGTSLISPIVAPGITGVETAYIEYHLHQTRTKYGVTYAHAINDWLRVGPGVSAVKEFFHYQLSPYYSSTVLLSPRGYAYTDVVSIGQRDRILSGSAPGFVIELVPAKNVKVYANYERFVLKGSSSESTLGLGLGFATNGTQSVGLILIGGLDAVNQKLEHSGHETTIGARIGEESLGFHIALTDRKFVRNITEYTNMNSAVAMTRGIPAAYFDSLSYSNIYRWHRYVQSEKYLVMKLELGVGF